jgi:hypothetical protein
MFSVDIATGIAQSQYKSPVPMNGMKFVWNRMGMVTDKKILQGG